MNIQQQLLDDVMYRGINFELLSNDKKNECFYLLATTYKNDKNSSTLRERHTAILAGYAPKDDNVKHGSDAINENDNDQFIEIKPKNMTGKTKLSGAGNFTDFTFARHKKHKKNKNGKPTTMLVAGFLNGEPVYVIEFPYSEIADTINKQLYRRFPAGKDLSNQYLRNAYFCWTAYKTSNNIKVIFINLDIDLQCLSKGFKKLLEKWKN